MAKPERIEEQVTQQHEEHDLKGTFVSVMILGAFLLVSWLGVWSLYLAR
ncbi:MAG: cytochrome c oxidase subunit 2A [Bacillales bacterium]